MNNVEISRSFIAGAAIAGNTLVKFGADDNTVVTAAAVGDSIIGISDALGQATTGARIDVVLGGIYEVVAGGAITRGAKITTNATGQAVAAAPAAGVNNQVIGVALNSAVAGDYVPVVVAQSTVQG